MAVSFNKVVFYSLVGVWMGMPERDSLPQQEAFQRVWSESTSQYGRRQGKSQEQREALRGTCDDVTPQQQGAGLWVRELTRATTLGSLVTTRSVSSTASRYCA